MQYKTRKCKTYIGKYMPIQDNTISYKTRYDATRHDITRQDTLRQDMASPYKTIKDKTTRYNRINDNTLQNKIRP